MAISLNSAYKHNKLAINTNHMLIDTLSWQEIRTQVQKIAPDIYNIIEKLDPDNSFKLFKIRYPYGATILDQEGIFNIPLNEKQLMPINNKNTPSSIVEQIGYNQLSLPLCLVLHGQAHLFSETKQNAIFTEGLYSTGDIIALGDSMNPALPYFARNFWRLTSGTRTPIMLPSISEDTSFIRLKRHFNLKVGKPVNQQDHWRLFVEIANHHLFPEQWHTELLVFSSKWLETRDDDYWKLFKLCLLERSCKRSVYSRNIATLNQIWDLFINNTIRKKTNGFVLAMVHYIIDASLNHAIVYAPFDSNEDVGPFNSLTNIFMDIYRLKKHAPIIMVPEMYNEQGNRPFYIPIQMMELHYTRTKSEESGSIMSDAREIKYLLEQFIHLIRQENMYLKGTVYSKLLNITYNFYHADKDKYDELIPSSHALEDDPVMQKWRKFPHNNEIAYKNEFMRACVKMMSR